MPDTCVAPGKCSKDSGRGMNISTSAVFCPLFSTIRDSYLLSPTGIQMTRELSDAIHGGQPPKVQNRGGQKTDHRQSNGKKEKKHIAFFRNVLRFSCCCSKTSYLLSHETYPQFNTHTFFSRFKNHNDSSLCESKWILPTYSMFSFPIIWKISD